MIQENFIKLYEHSFRENWVILTPSGMQETPYSEEIRFDGEKSCTDEELCDMIRFAQSLGLLFQWIG